MTPEEWAIPTSEREPCPIDVPKYFPPVIDQAINYAHSLLKHSLAGFPIVSEEIQKERMAICESNECGKFEPQSKRCYECGCNLEEKTSWATEECPIGKWKTSDAGQANYVKPSSCCGR